MVLLVEEILNHLGCIKPCEYWDKLIYLSTGAGFFPSTVSSCFHHKPDLDPNSSNWSVGVNWSHCLTAILCYNSFKKQMRFYPYTLLHGRYAVFQETNTTCMYIYIYTYSIFRFSLASPQPVHGIHSSPTSITWQRRLNMFTFFLQFFVQSCWFSFLHRFLEQSCCYDSFSYGHVKLVDWLPNLRSLSWSFNNLGCCWLLFEVLAMAKDHFLVWSSEAKLWCCKEPLRWTYPTS